MKVLELTGLGNDSLNKRSFFIFKLDEIFQQHFNEILEKIGLKSRIYDEQLPLSKRKNQLDYFKNDEFDIDVIYTSDRIIVLVRANKSDLERFKSLMLSYSKMKK